jgi:hypothetical protein
MMSQESKKIKVASLNSQIIKSYDPYFEQLQELGYCHEVIDVKDTTIEEADKIVQHCLENNIKGVLSYSMREFALQGYINSKLDPINSTNQYSIDKFKNKFIQRTYEENPDMWYQSFNLYDEDDYIVELPNEYPCMMKATAFFLGFYVYRVESKDEVRSIIKELRLNQEFIEYDKTMKKIHENFPKDIKPEVYPSILFERALNINKVRQFSCDCFSTHDKCDIFNIREEKYFETKHKIGYVFPPKDMDNKDLLKIQNFVQTFGIKLVKEGLINHNFNMEIFYITYKIKLTI